jgi:hypothetical protein
MPDLLEVTPGDDLSELASTALATEIKRILNILFVSIVRINFATHICVFFLIILSGV